MGGRTIEADRDVIVDGDHLPAIDDVVQPHVVAPHWRHDRLREQALDVPWEVCEGGKRCEQPAIPKGAAGARQG